MQNYRGYWLWFDWRTDLNFQRREFEEMKKILKIICIIPIAIGIIIGIIIGVKGKLPDNTSKKALANVVQKIQNKEAKLTNMYIYGTSLNLEGEVSGVSKDNLEGAKLILTDGFEETEYKLETSVKDGVMKFKVSQINNTIDLEKLMNKEYYILLRLKLNNSVNYKYYNLQNTLQESNMEYFTISKDGKNDKITIKFGEKEHKKEKYKFLMISKIESTLPEEVYDIVIDAGHGGTDKGEKSGEYNEANITLEYAIEIAKYLEDKGLKVKLTRDEQNTSTYTHTNMYDINGRISIACESKAKYMISLHVNNDSKKTSGFEIYSPSKCNLNFANLIAKNIKENTSIEYSSNDSYKKSDGVYVKNFNKQVIEQYAKIAADRGYELYPLDNQTPYLYTIREVGGIATNAYVDGRNTSFGANKYYKSNIGIEWYQIELGYIKTDLEKLLSEKEQYTKAIADAIIQKCK